MIACASLISLPARPRRHWRPCRGDSHSLTSSWVPIFSSKSGYEISCSIHHLYARTRTRAVVSSASNQVEEVTDDAEEFQVITAARSEYNDIVILDTPKSRILLLDSSHNVHSIFNKGQKWTGSYWDEFASLPAIVPVGPIAIFGLGGGTAAHLLLELWPSLQLEGWEIDELLIDKAREYLGLSHLEKSNEAGGVLNIHLGDALSPYSTIPGGYAGIIVDLFSDGKVLPQLQEVATWFGLKDKLMTNGRLMVNCGGTYNGLSATSQIPTHPEMLPSNRTWELNSTLKTMGKAFPGQLSWKKMSRNQGENFLALTGPLPDLSIWCAGLPYGLNTSVKEWRACLPS